jgi:predicted protein tyrosine phosphatase
MKSIKERLRQLYFFSAEVMIMKKKKHVLFVCTANVHRSPTAELMFSEHPDYEVRSAGTSMLAKMPVTLELVQWADVIFVMDEKHEGQKSYLLRNFPMVAGLADKIIVLNIQDRYIFGSEELVRVIDKKMRRYL